MTKDKDTDKEVEEFMAEFRGHGMECGQKIAEVARFLHQDALLIVPLYRSCIVVEQNGDDEKEGVCTIHSYADPHWLGRDIDVESLKSGEFHFIYKVRGDRQGVIISIKEKAE